MRRISTIFAVLALALSPILSKADTTENESNGFTLQFCDALASWYYIAQENKVDYKCYLYISAEIASSIAGNQLTEITFSCASDFAKTRDGVVFVTEDIDSEPLTATDCTIVDCYTQVQKGGLPYQTVALDKPYTIKANTGFYFGYTVKSCRFSQANGINADYPIGVDAKEANGYSGYVELTNRDGEKIGTVDMANDLNTNLFLAATTVGDVNSFENLLVLGSITLGDFALNIIDSKSTEPLHLPIRNIGSNTLTSIEYSLDVNGVPGDVRKQEIKIVPNAEKNIDIPAPAYTEGRNNIVLSVKKINGVDAALSSSVSCYALPKGGGFDRTLVVEEGTGTWCGYCPRGIVGLAKMTERYPDSFIGIAIHQTDDMAVNSYAPILNYFSGLPNCLINRDPSFILDPNIEYLEACKAFWESQRAPAKIDLTVNNEDGKLTAVANTTFAYDEENARYSLAFVMLEDGLQGKQSNYFAGNPGSLEWWGDQKEVVDWTYEHTARDIFDCFGLRGSIPSTIVSGTPVTYETSLSLENIKDLSQSSVVALLLDDATGVILNATKVSAKDYDDGSGVKIVSSDNGATEYFDLQGVRVAQPTKGQILIRRQSGNTTKIIL